MKSQVPLADRVIGERNPCFIIAEIGINHGGDPAVARALIEAAAAAGADAVKFQTYLTEKRVPADSPIFDILKQCELSFDAQAELKRAAEEMGLVFFSTPFDDDSVAWLDEVGVEVFKVASFDSVNKALLRRIATTGKPVIMSTGMATSAELDAAVEVLAGLDLMLLHCVSAYPTPASAANLSIIPLLKSRYGCPVGYSDHTIGVEIPVLAVAAGANLIEKHFTLDTSADGPDHALSADPATLTEMISRIREVETILGPAELGPRVVEAGTLQYRRPRP